MVVVYAIHKDYHRAFQAFGGFTSGIGVHYAPSVITNSEYQALASGLVVGERVPPRVFIRAADARPYEIQDLLPSDTRFKILAFVGNVTNQRQSERVNDLAEKLADSSNFYKHYSGGSPAQVFDILAISSCTKEQVDYTDLPQVFRPHWSK